MKNLSALFETYLMVLIHPFRIHHQFRFQLSLPGQSGHLFEPLTLSESLGISWLFAMMRGLFKLVLLNFFLQSFINMQSDRFPILQEMVVDSSISTYYFLLFTAALDIIFFPVSALVFTQLWSWIIRTYSKWLNPELPHDEIADQITTHALSSNLFQIIPIIGDVIQPLLYYFLLYAGIRSNLGASRSLAYIMLITPTVIGMMVLSLIAFVIFYLVS